MTEQNKKTKEDEKQFEKNKPLKEQVEEVEELKEEIDNNVISLVKKINPKDGDTIFIKFNPDCPGDKLIKLNGDLSRLASEIDAEVNYLTLPQSWNLEIIPEEHMKALGWQKIKKDFKN